MIRVFTTDEPGRIRITLDGQLVENCIAAVESCVDQSLKEARPVHVFLRDVTHIDDSGRSFLSRLAAKGIELSANGVYSSYVVSGILQQKLERAS